MTFKTLEWHDNALHLLDQRALPSRVAMIPCRTVTEVAEAIRNLTVRGAPAIGVAAAYGMVLAVNDPALGGALDRAAELFKSTRPTAINLAWAIDRMMRVANTSTPLERRVLRSMLEREAITIHEEDAAMCRKIGEHGAALLRDGMTILTHCNAGALATAGIGTALGVIYTARDQGKTLRVFADETRPVLQGARLTMWELMQEGIDATLITDNTAASLFGAGKIDAVIVGADRIARNGDVANKIGTYNLAVLAAHHNVPFYVAAPQSTFDPNIATGAEIPIEERSGSEVTTIGATRIAPDNCQVYSPAFDVTPNELITAIISDTRILPGGRFTKA
ncbi:MAG: S-methyl-5-thioribose-1-phosphate isomerase [candidate division Zixibacteria bacterium]|nr:S-methyl-5-thioribose-1-phosphate isomerase [candidate division Zixibacteria bacterium]